MIDTGWAVAIGIALFFILLSLGLEIIWSFMISGALIYLLIGVSLGDLPAIVFHNVDKEVLMAVVYFLFSGSLMEAGGVGEALVRWANYLVGRVRGGLAAVAIVASLIFGALTGSGMTSIAAIVPVLGERMEKYGYKKEYSIGVICASGFMGLLIPPSIPLLLIALLSEQSVAALFASTIVPGAMLAIFYLIINFFICRRWMSPKQNAERLEGIGIGMLLKNFGLDTWHALPALFLAVLLIGGIFSGIFTPTEAAAVSCVYAILIGAFVYRGLRLRNFPKVLGQTGATVGMIVILVGFGMFFSRVLLRMGVAEAATSAITSVATNPIVIILLVNILLLVLGLFMESICIILITVPLLLPLFNTIGINLVQAAAMITVNIGIGQVTPPFAVGLFVGARLSNMPAHQIGKVALIFVGLGGIPTLFLTAFVPHLSLWLPTILFGSKIVGPW